jgi:transposase
LAGSSDVYGPYARVFNCHNFWSKRGLWQRTLASLDLIIASRPSLHLLADRAYNGAAQRQMLIESGTTPGIPNKINRVNRHPFDAAVYRLRNTVKRAFSRLKDATRHDNR